jgi:hypothetical protein
MGTALSKKIGVFQSSSRKEVPIKLVQTHRRSTPAENLELRQIFGAATVFTAPSGTSYVVSPIVASPVSTAIVIAAVRAVASAAAVSASCSSTSGTEI